MEREELEILDICWGKPMIMNPVFDGLSDRRLAVIQDAMSDSLSWSWLIAMIKVLGANEKYLDAISTEVMI